MSEPKDYKLIVEKDVKIPLRDGTVLYADIFRPGAGTEAKNEGAASERFPVIMNIGPYMKDKLWVPPPDLEEKPNPYMNWETVNPLWWCPRGYALLRVDTRGAGKSPGKSDPSSYQEALDCYDCIEWVAKLPWCNGNVGTCGISYHAAFQWRVASLQPPSLKCILPWEGRADQYRDQAYHGGIFALGFIARWANNNTALHLLGKPRSYNPDSFDNNLLWNYMRNDLDSEYWRLNSARWDRITVPVFSAGNWGGSSMHLRGNTEGYLSATASKFRKLRIHTGTHYHPFHSEEARVDQLRWFDQWLKGIDTGILDEPPVKLEIRTGGSQKPYPFRFEDDWPIPRTQWTKYHLRIDRAGTEDPQAVEGELTKTAPQKSATVSYQQSAPSRPGKMPRGVSFETPPMAEDLEITGPIVLNIWVSSTGEDTDLFATLRNIDPGGKDVCEVGQMHEPMPCVTKGWLRASHRKLDPAKSLPYRPYHAHDERLWLKPGEAVECQVEIWPTSMVFRKGHKLRLDVSPADGVGTQHFTHFHADYNQGAETTIHSGGNRASYLLLPVIPAK
ncbi:MAG TPA: CocE/NonD family hydrolase [Burkholderiales bacterium]|nr:CocE/NonD family hydrolase [Burkholderiales bacterium]